MPNAECLDCARSGYRNRIKRSKYRFNIAAGFFRCQYAKVAGRMSSVFSYTRLVFTRNAAGGPGGTRDTRRDGAQLRRIRPG
jgi:hypothetical protein